MARADGKPGPEPGKGGRNPVIATGARQVILDAIGAGMSEADACRLAGLSEALLSLWKSRANKKGPNQAEYSKFVREMAERRTRLKFTLVTTVTSHAVRDGRLALAVLRSRWPEEWNPRPAGDAQGNQGDPPLLPEGFTVNFNHYMLQIGQKPVDMGGLSHAQVTEAEDVTDEPAGVPDSGYGKRFKDFATA